VKGEVEAAVSLHESWEVAGTSHWRDASMHKAARMAIDRLISRVLSSKVQYQRIPIFYFIRI
jgi:hypothetical protein